MAEEIGKNAVGEEMPAENHIEEKMAEETVEAALEKSEEAETPITEEEPEESAETEEEVKPEETEAAAAEENEEAETTNTEEEPEKSAENEEAAEPEDGTENSEEIKSEENEEAVEDDTEADGTVTAETAEKKKRTYRKKNAEPEISVEAGIEAVLFAAGNSVSIERLADILEVKKNIIRSAIENMKQQYEAEGRGITLMVLEDSVQLATKAEYYVYLKKMARQPRQANLSDSVIETLSIIAYKQPVTRAQIDEIRGVSCDHTINKLLEFDLIEEVGRLDAPGRPLLFGTTEQFLRSFGVSSLGELPTISPEIVEDFKKQAEEEATENLKVEI